MPYSTMESARLVSHPLPLAALKNLRRATERRLREVGVHTPGELEALGALVACCRVKLACSRDTPLVLLYALQSALLDLHWNALPPGLQEQLRVDAAAWETRLTPDGRSASTGGRACCGSLPAPSPR